MDKKNGIGPVVASALILVVAVVSVVAFQGWFSTYSTSMFSDVEIKSEDGVGVGLSIDTLVGDILYVINNLEDNLSIDKLEIGGVECFLNDNLSFGMNSLNVSDCIGSISSSTPDIVMVTSEGILEKTVYVKDISSFSSSLSIDYDINYSFINNCNASPIFNGGDGSVGSPYQICDCSQLQDINLDGTSNYILIANINCTDTRNWNGGLGFVPLVVSEGYFLDGLNHSIFNLFINRSNEDSVGLFSSNGNISNLGGDYFYINGKNDVASLIGTTMYSHQYLDNVYIKNSEIYGKDSVGGLVSFIDEGGYIKNSYSLDSKIYGISTIGGVLSGSDAVDLNYSYSNAELNFNENLGFNQLSNLYEITNINIYGDYLFILSGVESKFRIYDISNPSNFIFVNEVVNSTYLNGSIDVEFSDDVAYFISEDDKSITSWNISDLNNIVFLDEYENSTYLSYVSDIEILDDVAYVTSSFTERISSFNISIPSNIALLDSVFDSNVLFGVQDIELSGDVAYVVSRIDDSLSSWNISDPTNITLLYEKDDSTYLNGALGIELSGDVAYVVSEDDDSLSSWNISDPTNITLLFEFDSFTLLPEPQDIKLSGNIAYVITSFFLDYNITVFNISDPTNLTLLDISNGPLIGDFYYNGLEIYNSNLLYSNSAGLNIFDISNIEDIIIDNKYALSKNFGGIVGRLIGSGVVDNSYWDNETSGLFNSLNDGIGKTTLDMKTALTYSGWDTNIWNLTDGSYPKLSWE